MEYGFRCSFITEEGEEGYVILKRGKTGWNTKPIMNSPYVITESNMNGVLQIVSSKFDINEDHYEEIKEGINKKIERSLKDYLDPDEVSFNPSSNFGIGDIVYDDGSNDDWNKYHN
jgi:hypothetical protein